MITYDSFTVFQMVDNNYSLTITERTVFENFAADYPLAADNRFYIASGKSFTCTRITSENFETTQKQL